MGVIESHKRMQRKPLAPSFCITYTVRMDTTKSKGGRPRKDPEDTLVQRSQRLLPAHWRE
jgi:hypothetical protein